MRRCRDPWPQHPTSSPGGLALANQGRPAGSWTGFDYPWLDDLSFDRIRTDYLPTDYRAGTAGAVVAAWVQVQAETDHGLDPVGRS